MYTVNHRTMICTLKEICRTCVEHGRGVLGIRIHRINLPTERPHVPFISAAPTSSPQKQD